MNWSAIGAIGEIIGALAVVATLVYVAVQVRHMRRQARIATIQHIHDSMNALIDLVVTSESIASIVSRGRASYGSLSPDDQMRFDHLYSRVLNTFETWHVQVMQTFEPGPELEEQLRNLREAIRGYCRFPGVVTFWRIYESNYNPSIRRLVDDNIGDA